MAPEMLSNYYKTILEKAPLWPSILHPDEISLVRQHATYNDSRLLAAYQERLNLGPEYYHHIRRQITSILELWDALIDDKRRFDAAGRHKASRDFIGGFLFCSYLIPQRVNIGCLGPFVGVPQLSPHAPMTTNDEAVPHQHEGPFAIGNERRLPELLNLHGVVEDPEAVLARSTGFSDNAYAEARDRECDVISISSNESDHQDEYSDYEDEPPAETTRPYGAENRDDNCYDDLQDELLPWPSDLLHHDQNAWEEFLSDNSLEDFQSSQESAEFHGRLRPKKRKLTEMEDYSGDCDTKAPKRSKVVQETTL